jgi:hypothetical protein
MMIPKVRNPEKTDLLKSESPGHAGELGTQAYTDSIWGSSFLHLKLAADDI